MNFGDTEMGRTAQDLPVIAKAHPFDSQKDEKIDSIATESKLNPGSTVSAIKEFWASLAEGDDEAEVQVTKDDYVKWGFLDTSASFVDNYFHVTDRGSSILTEFIGGMTTFLSMSYIMILNGIIIGGPFNTGISLNGVFFATTLSAGLFTTAMGLFVNVPVALAPGMGLNGFFATIAPTCPQNLTGDINGIPCDTWGVSSLPWSDAMGAVFLSGFIYLFFTFTGLRSMLFIAVPKSLRAAITVGIGFFITIIGLKIGQITRITEAGFGLANAIPLGNCVFAPDGAVQFCANSVDLDYAGYEMGIAHFPENSAARIAVLGLVFLSGLEVLNIPGGIIIAIILATFVGINYMNCGTLASGNTAGCVTDLSIWTQPGGPIFPVDVQDIPSGRLTFKYVNTAFFWQVVWTFLFVELFDSFGTLTGIMTRCGFMNGTSPEDVKKDMARINRAMIVDGCGLWLGGIIGGNSITCFVESNTGIEAGARTGLASVFTGFAFLLSLAFLFPFIAIIPSAATTCALVMVGVHSLKGVNDINFDDLIDQLSAFMTIAIMGFTYSIANGICAGFIFFSWMRAVRWIQFQASVRFNRPKIAPRAGLETDFPHPLMVVISVFMACRFAFLNV